MYPPLTVKEHEITVKKQLITPLIQRECTPAAYALALGALNSHEFRATDSLH